MRTSRLLRWGLGLLLLGFSIWVFVVTQGAYFGPRIVSWIYNWGAITYDRVKRNTPTAEALFLGLPISRLLEKYVGAHPLLLDVAVGTARLPVALFATPSFQGEIVGVDLSRNMLAQAAQKQPAYGERLTLMHHSSVPLPFASETFDAVSCIEALEVMPDPQAALQEMVRVLRPGGWLIVTNRIGPTAALMPGRTLSTTSFESRLADLQLVEISTQPWKKNYFGQPFYHLLFARKPGTIASGQGQGTIWRRALLCPGCGQPGRGEMAADGRAWRCQDCGSEIQIEEDGVWVFP